ncbi:zinc finger protein 135-like [Sardina pilchardus]|uniref:zinc finger protein 135-like n=1 Tax=Sardina pilchardus TaxID=27697 RepID=UPI002E119C39
MKMAAASETSLLLSMSETDSESRTAATSVKARARASKAWKYFRTSGDRVICTLCKTSLAYHGSTTSMREHLKRKHKEVAEDAPEKEKTTRISLVSKMDLKPNQACIDLEKATQCITQALQHEVVQNQELRIMIRRLEEKEAETGRSLTEQVESNKQLKLKIDELYKHLGEKDHSLTQANQTVTFLKNELKDLNLKQDLQSQPSIRTVQDGNEWPGGGERQIRSPSSPLQPEQLTADDKSLVSEQLISEGQTPLMSPHGPTPLEAPVSAIKEERDERADPRLECTAAEGTDITFEQIQTPLVTSDGQRLLEAPVSEDEDDGGDDEEYGEYSHSGKGSSPSPSNSHTQTKKRRHYYCSECGKTFRLASALLQHQKTHKQKSQKVHCAPCGRSFTSDKNLLYHQLAVHTRKRPYQFTRHLKDHKRFEIGNWGNYCTQCGKSFIHKTSLKRHQRTHTGEKPYQCTQCGESFLQQGSLKTHQCTHT